MKNLNYLILFTCLILFSCRKEQKSVSTNNNLLPSAMATSNLPMIDGDWLHFNNFTQYDDYFEDLDFALEDPLNTDDDSLLSIIELNTLGFESLRYEVLERNGMNDENAEFTSEEIENMFQCDVIGGDLLKSVLNINHEVRIGDTVYIYFPEHLIIGVHHTYSAGIDALRDINKCNIVMSDFTQFFLDDNYIIQWVRSGKIIKVNSRETCQTYTDPSNNDIYGLWFEAVPEPCHSTRINFFSYIGTKFVAQDILAQIDEANFVSITIDVGEGGNILTSTDPLYFPRLYFYNTPGVKSITITGEFLVNGSTVQLTCSKEITVGGVSCDYIKTGTIPETFSDPTCDWKLQRKAWIEFPKVFYGPGLYRVGSWTRGFKKKSNGKWKKKRTSLYTGVKGQKRDITTCSPDGTFAVEDGGKIRRKLRESEKVFFPNKFQNGDVVAEHELRTEGVKVVDPWVICD